MFDSVHTFLSKQCSIGSLNATLVAGQIVLCFSTSGTQDLYTASTAVREAGGTGLIYADSLHDEQGVCDSIPCAKVDYQVGSEIFLYITGAR